MHYSTKIIELGSCAFRQPKATSHCRFLHGYRLTAKFWFASETLDQNNWVVDFGGLRELKKLLQDQFDHTTCISADDPHVDYFKKLQQIGVCDLKIMDGVGIEKFAEWCHAAADNFAGILTNMRCKCTRVEVFEHENNSAIYEPPVKPIPVLNQEQQQELLNEVKSSKSSTIEGMVRQSTNNPLPKQETTTKSTRSNPPVTNKKGVPEQTKTTNQWVDPKYKKTTNSWKF